MADLFSTYGFRKLITIHHSIDAALSDYPVLFRVMRTTGADTTEAYGRETANKIYVGTNCLATFYDFVLTTSDGVTIVKRCAEVINGTSDAYIWCKVDVPASGDWTGYAYYGKPSESANPDDGTNTFTFYDHFDGDLTKWAGDTAQASISNSILTYTYALAAWKAILSVNAYSGDIVVKSSIRMETATRNYVTGGGLRTGKDSATKVDHQSQGGTQWVTCQTGATVYSTTDPGVGAYHTIEMSRVLTGTDTVNGWLDNGAQLGPTTSNIATSNLKACIQVNGLDSATATILVDWIFIRKTTANMPAWAANGAEEAAPASSSMICMSMISSMAMMS